MWHILCSNDAHADHMIVYIIFRRS